MPQFDVFAQKYPPYPRIHYIPALQSDILAKLDLLVVAPLKTIAGTPQFHRLTPILSVLGERFLFTPMELLTVPVRSLGAPVANLAGDRDRIIAALDVLFTGV